MAEWEKNKKTEAAIDNIDFINFTFHFSLWLIMKLNPTAIFFAQVVRFKLFISAQSGSS